VARRVTSQVIKHAVLLKLIIIQIHYFARFQVLMAASMKTKAFWNVAARSLVEFDGHVRGAYCVHYQDSEALMTDALSTSKTSVSLRLHGTISQKTVIFILFIFFQSNVFLKSCISLAKII
jgi:hypothetical protein